MWVKKLMKERKRGKRRGMKEGKGSWERGLKEEDEKGKRRD